jgi:colicin import membrane protein
MPSRQVATAETVNDAPNIGTASGAAAQLSQSEIDALRARIASCWNPPAGVDAASKVYVVLRVFFRPDATMAQEPALVEATASALGPALAESAKRALLMCQPFTMLRPEHYDQWKDLELKFDPKELLGG